MKLLDALITAAEERGWSASIFLEPSGKVSTLREAYTTFYGASLYESIEVGDWRENQITFEAPDLTQPGDPKREASIRLLSEAAVKLMNYAMLGQGLERNR